MKALLELGFRVEESAWREPHILGVGMPAARSVHRLREALEARNVQVSVRGESLRVSPHVYNGAADMEALLDALAGTG